ncbi:adenine phosphoribosyltransferase [Blastococcus aurantiacus]|uniref:Adenine phosphoribosyltransferase n=1 Tax=Blastococcus aurantiacus TaxID=1550231 RepID=A0A1G7P8U6_9ACTN|nr:phosphoribosyltransferase [Blastococcus aurantiacus]SDF82644.1 adenine phosphoribosyltransferase [Blastococcus aurantiacus]
MTAARDALLAHFRWSGGHADVWRVFADADALAAVMTGLADSWRDEGITRVVGIESRGFLLGAAAAVSLAVGFVAVRKEGGLFPGPKVTVEAAEDYRGLRHRLRMQAVLDPRDPVLLVDDWAERGSQAAAVQHLVESTGATFAGVSLLVDQLRPAARTALGRVTTLATADELGDPGA